MVALTNVEHIFMTGNARSKIRLQVATLQPKLSVKDIFTTLLPCSKQNKAKGRILLCKGYGPVRLQRFCQRMPTYEKLMQNVGIR